MHKTLLIFFLLSCFTVIAQDNTTLLKNGSQIPSFVFEDEAGNIVSTDNLRGKVVIINFFATWCKPCLAELPLLHDKIWNKYKNNSSFALFVFGRGETKEKTLTFKTANKYTFPMIQDESKAIFSLFATQSIPKTIVIDKEGKIVFQSIGFVAEDFNALEKIVATTLK